MPRVMKDFHVDTLTEMMLGVSLVSGDPRTAPKQRRSAAHRVARTTLVTTILSRHVSTRPLPTSMLECRQQRAQRDSWAVVTIRYQTKLTRIQTDGGPTALPHMWNPNDETLDKLDGVSARHNTLLVEMLGH